MSDSTDVVLGSLKLLGKIDCKCFTSWKEFVTAIPSMFGVEVPSSITNVIISNSMPDDDQHDCIWFRLNAAGNFVGMFLYITGDWRQIYPVPNQIFRVYGNSGNIPEGFALVDSSNSHFTASEITAIQATWIPAGGPTYTVFDITYEGF